MHLQQGLIALFALVPCMDAQSTQGLVFGNVSDSLTGNSISGAEFSALNRLTGVERVGKSDLSGNYVLPLLSPGIYRIRAAKDGYQTQELHELDLAVAATLSIPFRLRPREDVWEQKQRKSVFLPGNSLLPFYGPDVDMSRTGNFEANLGLRGVLESTVSRVVSPLELRDLPLAGRDVYALLITLPGVTTDASAGRGLGLTVNGQRPSSSNFLLDGLENNNYLITGPLATVAPEAIEEYRVSTNNFTAEYGRTSGFIANAVTRSGSEHWHGIGYMYAGNDVLNANSFQRNTNELSRLPVKDVQPGFSVSGPTGIRSLSFSLSFEYSRFRSLEAPQEYKLPSSALQPQAGSFAAVMLNGYRGPEGMGPTVNLNLAAPDSLNRILGLPRLDYLFKSGSHRLLVRTAISNVTRPDFIWSPYPGYSSPLAQKATGFAAAWLGTLRPSLTNEARIGFSMDDLHFDRAHAEVPVLSSEDQTTLPGSPSSYSYRNRTHSLEFLDNLIHTAGKHVFKAGAGGLIRTLSGYVDINSGYYAFLSVQDFAAGAPDRARVALSRADLPGSILPAQPNREFRYNQFFGFAQDSYRIHPRLVINYGIRYEYFGSPRSTGTAKDPTIQLGAGSDPASQLRGASLAPPPSGDQQLYQAEKSNWATRLGFSLSLRKNARTLLRGSLGTFYDRPFDNLWQNIRANGFVLSTISPFAGAPVIPLVDYLPRLRNPVPDRNFSRMYLFPTLLRTPKIESYFLGVEHQLARNWTVELNALGSWGHRLFTTDYVNRGLYSQSLSNNVFSRSNDGFSYYNALALSTRYQSHRTLVSLSYTWSHSIDNQSEPLRGEFFDLLVTKPGATAGNGLISTFSKQFDWQVDKGNSDFDQRHNLVFFSVWNLPGPHKAAKAAWLLRDWRLSHLMGIHSGFPFTVTSGSSGNSNTDPGIYNRRPDLISPGSIYSQRAAIPDGGGVRILNRSAFQRSNAAMQGNLGRNSLVGPGFYSLDVSISRRFAIRRLGDSRYFTIRADAFNVLNHVNLDNPNSDLTSGHFGEALFGRSGLSSTFPALLPLSERPRQIQLLLRFEF